MSGFCFRVCIIVLVISVWSAFGVSRNRVPGKYIGQVQSECSRFCFHGLNPSMILTPAFFFGARQFELSDVFRRWFHVLGDLNDLCRYKDCFLFHFNGWAFSLRTLSESRIQTSGNVNDVEVVVENVSGLCLLFSWRWYCVLF